MTIFFFDNGNVPTYFGRLADPYISPHSFYSFKIGAENSRLIHGNTRILVYKSNKEPFVINLETNCMPFSLSKNHFVIICGGEGWYSDFSFLSIIFFISFTEHDSL